MIDGRSRASAVDAGRGTSRQQKNSSAARSKDGRLTVVDTNALVPEASRFNARECASYIAQLRGVLDAATAEPPAGVDTSEVERRMTLVQAALQRVEERSEELRRDREERQNCRFIETQRRRMEAEEAAEQERTTSDKHRRELVQEMRDLQVAYYKDRNDKTDEKAVRCREHSMRVELDTMEKAGSNEGRRQKNLANLQAERERACRELHEKGEARQEYARSVNKRRAAEQERDRLQRSEQSRLHEQEVQAKLEAMREARRSKWVAKRHASRARSVVVFENGKAVLETQALDHGKLVKELDEKVRGQQERYATEQAERQYLQQMRTQYRTMQQERQQQNLIKIIDGRLARGDVIVKEAHEKMEKGDLTKERQGTQYREAGAALRKGLAEHQRRAQTLETERQNDALTKNFRRWNTRAARIIEELRDAIEAEEEQKQRGAAHRRNADDDGERIASPRPVAVRLPSPSDFSTQI